MRKLKILFSIPNFDTAGSGKALLNIAKGLDPERFESHILCKHDKGEFFKVVKASGIPVHVFDYETPMRPILKGLKGCWQISEKLKKINPDIIHSFHYSAEYSEALAAKMAGIKWVYTKKNMSWGGSSANAWKLRTFLANALAVQNTDMLERFFAHQKEKCQLIPRGVNTVEFEPLMSSTFPKEHHQEKWLICVANLVPVKGVEVLIKAFENNHQKFPDWKLRVVGDNQNDYGQQLLQYVQKAGLKDYILFTGKVKDVKSFLQSSDIFVLPTLNKGEGSPVSMLEAMSMAKPVLGSNIPGIRDQLALFPEHLFEAGNITELAIKLATLMRMDESERRILGSKFREHVLSHYSLESEIKKHEALYLSIL